MLKQNKEKDDFYNKLFDYISSLLLLFSIM